MAVFDPIYQDLRRRRSVTPGVENRVASGEVFQGVAVRKVSGSAYRQLRAGVQAMREGHRRYFAVRDGIVLVLATAIGFAMMRENWYLTEPYFDRPEGGWTARATIDRVVLAVELASPCLVTWTFGILGLRLLQPRPPLRRLLLQPGFVACFAGSAAMAMHFSYNLSAFTMLAFLGHTTSMPLVHGHAFVISHDHLLGLYIYLVSDSPQATSYAIAAAWGLLALGRRWRPERSWIDRAGCIIGLLWIGLTLCAWWREVWSD